jgi:hypothetical protein
VSGAGTLPEANKRAAVAEAFMGWRNTVASFGAA